jgi:hypothetical protein
MAFFRRLAMIEIWVKEFRSGMPISGGALLSERVAEQHIHHVQRIKSDDGLVSVCITD